jgi:hypothetical protein
MVGMVVVLLQIGDRTGRKYPCSWLLRPGVLTNINTTTLDSIAMVHKSSKIDPFCKLAASNSRRTGSHPYIRELRITGDPCSQM